MGTWSCLRDPYEEPHYALLPGFVQFLIFGRYCGRNRMLSVQMNAFALPRTESCCSAIQLVGGSARNALSKSVDPAERQKLASDAYMGRISQ